jgi:predicted transcriptional regulator
MATTTEIFRALGQDGAIDLVTLLSRRGAQSFAEAAHSLGWEVSRVEDIAGELSAVKIVSFADGQVKLCRSKLVELRHLLEFLSLGPVHVEYHATTAVVPPEPFVYRERPTPAHELLGL